MSSHISNGEAGSAYDVPAAKRIKLDEDPVDPMSTQFIAAWNGEQSESMERSGLNEHEDPHHHQASAGPQSLEMDQIIQDLVKIEDEGEYGDAKRAEDEPNLEEVQQPKQDSECGNSRNSADGQIPVDGQSSPGGDTSSRSRNSSDGHVSHNDHTPSNGHTSPDCPHLSDGRSPSDSQIYSSRDASEDQVSTNGQDSTMINHEHHDNQEPDGSQHSDESQDSDDNHDSDDNQDSDDSQDSDGSQSSDDSQNSDDSQRVTAETSNLDQTRTLNAVHEPRFQEALGNVIQILCNIGVIMSAQNLTKDPTSHLHELHQETMTKSLFRVPETRTLGFIGESGAGKSSVINSLLGLNIARSSRSGSACTCVVTEFRNADSALASPYTIEAIFMEENEIHELLEELLRDHRQYYCAGQSEVEFDSKEEQLKSKDKALRALETLQTMFKRQRKVSKRFLKEDRDELEILAELKNLAHAEMARLPGTEGLRLTMTATDIEGCRSHLEGLTSTSSSSTALVLWPFIKLIKVYLHSPILQKGLILVDMPGLGDLNFARVRATQTYLLRNCDEVFMVAEMSRCSSNMFIVDMKRNFSWKDQQGIIVTRSDDVSLEESLEDDKISQKNRQALRGINTSLLDITRQITAIRTRTKSRTTSPEERAALSDRRLELEDEKEAKEFELQKLLINERNTRNTRQLLKKHSGMQVFCVGNELFSMYRDGEGSQAEAYRSLSGIPRFQRYCQLVPIDAKGRVTVKFVEHGVQSLVTSIRQWCLTGNETMTSEKGIIVRKVLLKAIASLLEDFQSQQAQFIRLRMELDSHFNNLVLQPIRQNTRQWIRKSIELHSQWKKLHSSTYGAICRHNGNFKRNYWNDELSRIPRKDLEPGWKRLLNWLNSQNAEFSAKITASFDEMHDKIKEIEHHASKALENLMVGLRFRQQNVIFSAQEMIQNLHHTLEIEQQDMLESHDSSWIAGLMRPAYLGSNRFTGPGCYRARVDHMDVFLATQSPFNRYYERSQAFYRDVVRDGFKSFQTAVKEETDNLEKDTNAVISEKGTVPETELAPGLVGELVPELQKLEEALKVAQEILKWVPN